MAKIHSDRVDPTVTVSSDSSATAGQQIALANLVAISDPGNVGYQKLELWDFPTENARPERQLRGNVELR